jgi:hypothetical protein
MADEATERKNAAGVPHIEVTPEMIEAASIFAAESGKFPDRWEKDEPELRAFVFDLLATSLNHREAI